MSVVLALYPNARGLGYACIELPQRLLEYGVITVRPNSQEKLLTRIQKFLDFFQPKIIVIREDSQRRYKVNRLKKIVSSVEAFAVERNITVHQYSREAVKEVFAQFGTTTKYEIAMKIVEWFPELNHRTPKLRKAWMDEDYNMGIFDAISLAVTHAYIME